MTIGLSPVPQWPIALRNARALHGAITAIVDMPHTRFAAWSLIPWQTGWAVYWAHDALADSLSGSRVDGILFDRPTAFQFGPLARMRAPGPIARGRSRIRLDAITPVVFRDGGGVAACTRPSTTSVVEALSGELLYRLSPTHRNDVPRADPWSNWVRPRVCAEMVERETEPCHVPLGGKYGTVSGWQGSVVLDVNACARWILTVCARGVGLGYRTAFGFGRIRITEVVG